MPRRCHNVNSRLYFRWYFSARNPKPPWSLLNSYYRTVWLLWTLGNNKYTCRYHTTVLIIQIYIFLSVSIQYIAKTTTVLEDYHKIKYQYSHLEWSFSNHLNCCTNEYPRAHYIIIKEVQQVRDVNNIAVCWCQAQKFINQDIWLGGLLLC